MSFNFLANESSELCGKLFVIKRDDLAFRMIWELGKMVSPGL